jgi:hypothetical protein
MGNEDEPEFPTIYAGTDESEITETHQQAQWIARIANRVDEIAKHLAWTYEIGDYALSTSSKFRFICRAKVNWHTEDDVYQTLEALWEDNLGHMGGISAPIEKLTPEQHERFRISGAGVQLLNGGSAEWLSNLKNGENDA